MGWDADFDGLSATLELPPGWRLLHASGVDRAQPTWIASWTLLDLFVVMVVAMATLRLFGVVGGGLALATLALVYTEPGAPRWVWLFVLAAEALRRAVPEGRLARALRWLRLGAYAALIADRGALRGGAAARGPVPRARAAVAGGATAPEARPRWKRRPTLAARRVGRARARPRRQRRRDDGDAAEPVDAA